MKEMCFGKCTTKSSTLPTKITVSKTDIFDTKKIADEFKKICTNNGKNEYTLGVFIDLSKAFDTVDHSLLLKKLELYGITDRNYAWIKSYLSNRLQDIQIDENSRTEFCVVRCGVPQGSILGPVLFLL